MDKNIFKGEWNEIKGKFKEEWGKLTDDDLVRIDGKKDQLIGALQKRYGYAKNIAEKDLKKFEDKCAKCACDKESCKKKDVAGFSEGFDSKRKVG